MKHRISKENVSKIAELFADNFKCIWTSKDIAELTGLSLPSVSAGLNRLKDVGLIIDNEVDISCWQDTKKVWSRMEVQK